MLIIIKLRNFLLNIIIKLFNFANKYVNSPFLVKIKTLIESLKADLIYISEGKDWVIYTIGNYIVNNLKKSNSINAIIGSPFYVKNKIIHFGTINLLLTDRGLTRLHPSNTYILTWFHIVPGDNRLKYIPIINQKIDKIHTSSKITKEKLIELGFDEKKVVCIPLGVDSTHFNKYPKEKIIEIKKKYNIPQDKFIIGSFQKDGVGWGEGNEPKMVKGPDILCKVLSKLDNELDIHVLLAGPSRGYVKNQLKKYGVAYSHVFMKEYLKIVDLYNILDLYLITSRTEGGPMSILEAMASGIPVISTRVGMAEEIITNGFNGYIIEVEDVEQIFNYSKKILQNNSLRRKLSENATSIVKNYDWKYIAQRYFLDIYKEYLGKI